MKFDLRINFSIFDQISYPVKMDSNFTSRPQKIGSGDKDDLHLASLVLHNDDINSFDYVMEVLVEVFVEVFVGLCGFVETCGGLWQICGGL